MKKLALILTVLLCPSAVYADTMPLSEQEHLAIAKRHIFEVQNIPLAEQHLYNAHTQYGSSEAAVLLAKLEIHKSIADKTVLKSDTWNEKVISLTEPHIKTNDEAAFLNAVTNFPDDITEALPLFLKAASLNNSVAALYAGTIYQHDLKQLETAEKYYSLALEHGCPVAADYLISLKKITHVSPEYFKLMHRAAQQNGISAQYTMSIFLDDIAPEEAEYWLRRAHLNEKEYKRAKEIPLFDLDMICKN